MRNFKTAKCSRCNCYVLKGKGYVEKVSGTTKQWRTLHFTDDNGKCKEER